ncbi:helix-turn-helix transcriptional regulator [Pedobacter sp. HDW13]|uniref:response regulator transcription factor n=1 Tax=Pedobacter sp. HDW13 TaxID=2714940 RepID=UPI0014090C0F|nr:helix-turn-helix transcriptional regulator [Pedobacter sp. HDW13]QIL38761.1 helix-turn-helix transcriptional regulator [Pedobacter sp. HDW13]
MKADNHTGLLTKNKIENVTSEDILQLDNYLEAISAFEKLTYQSVYVIDYAEMKFEYVSSNPLFLCGHTVAEVMTLGYGFYFNNVPEKDLQLLDLINESGFNFFEKLPLNEKKLYSITYDFHLLNKGGKATLINHKLTPLFLNSEGKMWKAICVVSISANKTAGNAAIHRHGSDQIWELDLTRHLWQKQVKPQLSERELEVLRLYAQGLTISQIADKIFVSPDTVKYYRRKIFQNFGVSNIVEALSYAVNNKVI